MLSNLLGSPSPGSLPNSWPLPSPASCGNKNEGALQFMVCKKTSRNPVSSQLHLCPGQCDLCFYKWGNSASWLPCQRCGSIAWQGPHTGPSAPNPKAHAWFTNYSRLFISLPLWHITFFNVEGLIELHNAKENGRGTIGHNRNRKRIPGPQGAYNPDIMSGLCWGARHLWRRIPATWWLSNPILLARQLRATAGFLKGVTEKHVEFGRVKNTRNRQLVKTGVGGGNGDSTVHLHHLVRGKVCLPNRWPFLCTGQCKLQAAEVDAHSPLVTIFLSSPEFSPTGLLDLVHSAQEVEGGHLFPHRGRRLNVNVEFSRFGMSS